MIKLIIILVNVGYITLLKLVSIHRSKHELSNGMALGTIFLFGFKKGRLDFEFKS